MDGVKVKSAADRSPPTPHAQHQHQQLQQQNGADAATAAAAAAAAANGAALPPPPPPALPSPLPSPHADRSGENAPLRLRKNGKAQSCEPCRKSKLRCDHNSPCGRCARLGRADKCIFHPAPLARATIRQQSPASEQPEVRPPKRPSTAPQPARNPPAERPQLPRKPSNPGVNPLTLGSLGYRRSRGMRPKLFYGQTSHSAILYENRATLGDDGFDEQDHETNNVWSNQQILNFGKAILDWMPQQDVSEQAVQRYFSITFSVSTHEPTMSHFHSSFWNLYGSRLASPRKPARLLEIAEELNKNTCINSAQAPDTNDAFLQSFRGRWEAVGLILLLYGSLAFMLSETDPLLAMLIPSDVGKKDFALSMLECADACLILCDELDSQSNMLAVMLFYRCVCLQSLLNVEGDTSLDLWKRAGSLLSTITGHGLHQLGPTGPGSILYQEQQKRTFAVSFMWVMSLAAFLGRPPPLSSRYALTPPPLDVNDATLMYEDLAAVTADLDENGWNVHNKIYPATLTRAGYMSSFMYEEILEISLGSQNQDPYAISARIRNLRVKLQAYQDQLPPIFRTALGKGTFGSRTAWEVCGIVQIQLANLHQLFLMERIDHPEKDEQRHLEAAHQMLNIIVVLWNERDRIPEHFDELHWYITCYGIPSASALGISLWRQAHSPQDNPPSRHRSEIIMNLSVFLACLDWIPSHDGNYVLCRRSGKLIRHILDGILAPQPPEPAPNAMLDLSPFDFANMPDMPAFNAGLDDWFMADWASAPRLDFN